MKTLAIQGTLCLFVLTFCVSDAYFWSYFQRPFFKKCVEDAGPCARWWYPIPVTLRVENDLVEPYFNLSMSLKHPRCQLLYFLQEAADKNKTFQFSADYFAGLGYSIKTINKLRADFNTDGTWWSIIGGDGKLTPCGVSSYMPSIHETIVFKFTNSSGH